MRPNPDLIANAVRQILKDRILPELRPGTARDELRRVLGVMRDTPWSQAARLLHAENQILAEAVALATQGLAASGPAGDVGVTNCDDPVRSASGEREGTWSFGDLEADNRRLRMALDRRIGLLAAGTGIENAALRIELAGKLAGISCLSAEGRSQGRR